jgi:arylsulfatase A-like enzyme
MPAPAGLLLAGLALLSACGGGDGAAEPARRPNVVFVLIDTLRGDRLGAYGYPHDTSPFLDGLAREGALFEDVTAQAPWTLPSMVSMLQGAYVTAYRDALDPDRAALAEAFRKAGYDTIGVVSNRGMNAAAGFRRGFRWYDDRPPRNAAGEPVPLARSVEETLADLRAHLDHAESLRGGEDRPTFLYVHLMDPHQPLDPYPELDGVLPDRAAAPPMPRDWQTAELTADGPPPPADDPAWSSRWAEIERDRARYDRGVRHTDDGLRLLLDELRGRGLLEHALVVVAADHGECLWERRSVFADGSRYARSPPDEFFHAAHGAHLHRELLATPLVLWGAGVPAGVRIAAPVENVDLFPTLLELADLPAVPGLHGRSLVPLLFGAEPARDAVFAFNHSATAVRELATGLKLILPSGGGAPVETQLYDLRADPEERVNLAAERPHDVRRLAERIAAWHARHPTATTLGAPRDPEQEAALRALGYTADEIGR